MYGRRVLRAERSAAIALGWLMPRYDNSELLCSSCVKGVGGGCHLELRDELFVFVDQSSKCECLNV